MLSLQVSIYCSAQSPSKVMRLQSLADPEHENLPGFKRVNSTATKPKNSNKIPGYSLTCGILCFLISSLHLKYVARFA